MVCKYLTALFSYLIISVAERLNVQKRKVGNKMFGLSMKVAGVGVVKKEWKRATLHDVKSKAGKAFHADNVESVCVFDEDGTARLYLKKTADGVYREER